MSEHYPIELRKCAVKKVLDHRGEYRSMHAAAQAIGPEGRGWSGDPTSVGAPRSGRCGTELWCHHSRAGTQVERENRYLKEANEILKEASTTQCSAPMEDTPEPSLTALAEIPR